VDEWLGYLRDPQANHDLPVPRALPPVCLSVRLPAFDVLVVQTFLSPSLTPPQPYLLPRAALGQETFSTLPAVSSSAPSSKVGWDSWSTLPPQVILSQGRCGLERWQALEHRFLQLAIKVGIKPPLLHTYKNNDDKPAFYIGLAMPYADKGAEELALGTGMMGC